MTNNDDQVFLDNFNMLLEGVGASPVNEEKTLTPIEVQDLLNAIAKTVVAGNGYRGDLVQYEQP